MKLLSKVNPGTIARKHICMTVACLMTMTATNRAAGNQLQPQYAMERARQNEANHITFMSLHFCPGWSDAIYNGQEYKFTTKAPRIILKLDADGAATVNPPNEPQGRSLEIIDLGKIDEKTAREVWGGRANADGSRTFDLITEGGSIEMAIYHLDAHFAKGKAMTAYRLRGSGILKPKWVYFIAPQQDQELKNVAPPSAFDINDYRQN